MEPLGHSQMRTTMDIYSHVMPALARQAADRMGTVLLAGKGGQTATTTGTKDDSGRPSEGKRPAHQGGPGGSAFPPWSRIQATACSLAVTAERCGAAGFVTATPPAAAGRRPTEAGRHRPAGGRLPSRPVYQG